ncbi:hypothetical protein [Virgisporangium aurantiacum]|uniref:Uncharacterized protein n=1 Tax=Virgisporangium aurantiacum TaxID=175570 RepID=A0A8J3Z471_9ACTN|nr:hypothetical protein [Virgisporangium aurantiacum]GIJ54951.1 hypothetical protein Vau01_024670 [Virgisporangium aurantiacum]
MTEGPDARLLDELRMALDGCAGPPAGRFEGLLSFASFAGAGAVRAELLDPPVAEPVGLRGPAHPGGVLVFEVGDGSLAVEVVAAHGRLDGQVLVGGPVEVVLERVRGPARARPVDDLGRFTFARPGSGPARLRLGPVTTDWFLLL